MSKASLSGIMAKKGAAVAPEDQPQRAAPVKAEPKAKPAPAAVKAHLEGPTKALTIKLPLEEYRRLKHYAIDHGTHQDIVMAAIGEYLDKYSGS